MFLKLLKFLIMPNMIAACAMKGSRLNEDILKWILPFWESNAESQPSVPRVVKPWRAKIYSMPCKMSVVSKSFSNIFLELVWE